MNGIIIAAVRHAEEFRAALESDVQMNFMLAPNIEDIEGEAHAFHKVEKKHFIRLD